MKENSKPISSVLQSKSVINKEIYGLKHKATKKSRRKMETIKERRAEGLSEEFGSKRRKGEEKSAENNGLNMFQMNASKISIQFAEFKVHFNVIKTEIEEKKPKRISGEDGEKNRLYLALCTTLKDEEDRFVAMRSRHTQVGGKDEQETVDIVRKQVCIKDPKETKNEKDQDWVMRIQEHCQLPLNICEETAVKLEKNEEIQNVYFAKSEENT